MQLASGPAYLQLQWHVTERCNLRCMHCYQESYEGTELGLSALEHIYQQYLTLLQRLGGAGPARGRIVITGGEPFLRPDFFRVLELFAQHRDVHDVAILTNGTLIDAALARRLAAQIPAFVQVSLDGNRLTHEAVRGRGTFDRAVAGLRQLIEVGIPTVISFTAHAANYRQFPEVARLGARLGVKHVWADRIIPCGSGAALEAHSLAAQQAAELFSLMARADRAVRLRSFGRVRVRLDRALQFLESGRRPYRCHAAARLIAVLPDGSLVPCRRMPIRVGNLLHEELSVVYEESPVFQQLRDRSRVSIGCEACVYHPLCGGGLRCLSYALRGDPLTADPGCWRACTQKE